MHQALNRKVSKCRFCLVEGCEIFGNWIPLTRCWNPPLYKLHVWWMDEFRKERMGGSENVWAPTLLKCIPNLFKGVPLENVWDALRFRCETYWISRMICLSPLYHACHLHPFVHLRRVALLWATLHKQIWPLNRTGNCLIMDGKVGISRTGSHRAQALISNLLEVDPYNLSFQGHGSWELSPHMGSQVLSPKYDTNAYMTTLFGGETQDLCWKLGEAKSYTQLAAKILKICCKTSRPTLMNIYHTLMVSWGS